MSVKSQLSIYEDLTVISDPEHLLLLQPLRGHDPLGDAVHNRAVLLGRAEKQLIHILLAVRVDSLQLSLLNNDARGHVRG